MLRWAALGVLVLCAALGGTLTGASAAGSRSLQQSFLEETLGDNLSGSPDDADGPAASIGDRDTLGLLQQKKQIKFRWLALWLAGVRADRLSRSRRARSNLLDPPATPDDDEPPATPSFLDRLSRRRRLEPPTFPDFGEPPATPDDDEPTLFTDPEETPAIPDIEEPAITPVSEEPPATPEIEEPVITPVSEELPATPDIEEPAITQDIAEAPIAGIGTGITPISTGAAPSITASGIAASTPSPVSSITTPSTRSGPESIGVVREVPQATEDVNLQGEGIRVDDGEVFEGELKRYYNVGDGSQREGQQSVFTLGEGAVLQNAILGAPAGNGVRCLGSCQLLNVWWEDVGEDAMTAEGGPGATMVVEGGGAFFSEDKTLQVNKGGDVEIRNFYIDGWRRAFRLNNPDGETANLLLENVVLANGADQVLAGYIGGNTVTFRNVTIENNFEGDFEICRNEDGQQARTLAEAPFVEGCIIGPGDIIFD